MKNSLTILFLLMFFVSFSNAQTTTDQESIVAPIKTFFEGMHQKDTSLIRSSLYHSTRLATTATDKSGKSLFKEQSIEQFIKSIASFSDEQVLEEKILDYEVKVDDNLAIVWTPYEFYFNNNFSHCGVNAFELFQTETGWKITSIIDTRRKEGCGKSEK